MATIYRILGLICLIAFGRFVELNGNFLGSKTELKVLAKNSKLTVPYFNTKANYKISHGSEFKSWTINEDRAQLLNIAQSQIGVRETTGNNDGCEVETYLRFTGNKKGEPWCASFVSWVFGQAGFLQPRSAWSPNLLAKTRLVVLPMPANVFGIYFSELKRIAHCGLVEKINRNWIATIEGNTNINNSREGDGVYRKLRHQRTIALYADWINQLKKGDGK